MTSVTEIKQNILKSMCILGFPGGSDGKESAYNTGDPGSIPGLGRFSEKATATHTSILAWRILWREESGWLQPMGSQRVRHKQASNTFTFHLNSKINSEEKEQSESMPLPDFKAYHKATVSETSQHWQKNRYIEQ